MIDELNNLCDAAEAFLKISRESESLDAREKSATAELDAACASGGLEDEHVSRKIARANSDIAVVSRRRKHVDAAIQPALERLKKALLRADSAFTGVVNANAIELSDRYFKINGKLFKGGEQEARQHLTAALLPGVGNKASLLWHGDASVAQSAAKNIMSIVAHFIRHVEGQSKTLNLTLPPRI